MIRFLRALWRALLMTLRGETLTPPHFQPLETWIAESLKRLHQVYTVAEAQHFDLARRENLQLKLDGHPTSLEQTLQMLRHNLVNEYPRLIRLDDPHSMLVIQSSNLNDQYRLGQFLATGAITSPALHKALAHLKAHISQLPPIEKPQIRQQPPLPK